MWSRFLSKKQAAEVSIPWDIGISPARGQFGVCFGAPGVGKSLFGLNWALRCNEPTLVVSLDTDIRTQAFRACAILSGRPMSEVKANPGIWPNYLKSRAAHCSIYDLQLTTREINELVKAETEYRGISPAIVVIDNLSNIVKDISYESYRNVCVDLQKLARIHESFVLALHHVRRDASEGRPKLHSGQYAGEQDAEIVLGLWRDEGGLNVSILKNRNGQADPSGGLSYRLKLDHENMRIT